MINWNQGINAYIDALASDNPAPGGGSAAAAAGALGCALAGMAVKTTLKLKSTPAEIKPALENAARELDASMETFKKLIMQDGLAYQKYVDAKRAAKTDPAVAMNPFIKEISLTPVNCALEAIKTLKTAANIESGISKIIVSDLNCARYFLGCCIKCAVENMRINLPLVKEENILELLNQTIDHGLKTLETL